MSKKKARAPLAKGLGLTTSEIEIKLSGAQILITLMSVHSTA